MAANLLHSLTDDNPDLQKQIGCMTGIFQLFDRQHMLAGSRHAVGLSPRRLHPGSSCLNVGTLETESASLEKYVPKNMQERQRVSTESSRASFSSSSHSSSFSSPECNRAAQLEQSSFDKMIFLETPSGETRQNIDLRDFVKDSMYREIQGLSVKDKSSDDCKGSILDRREQTPTELRESLRVLAKLQEVSQYRNEPRELLRSTSCHFKDRPSFSRDAPQFSYDGRDMNRAPFDSGDVSKSSIKLKDLPRLSLDSRDSSVPSFITDPKSNFDGKSKQMPGNQGRPPSVVAKLMGLEALPDSIPCSDASSGLEFVNISSSFEKTEQIKLSSPRYRSMKPIARFPIEPAPWKQVDGLKGSQKLVSRSARGTAAKTPTGFRSVYSEIEKRLYDLEFNQSGKDLRALRQILEAMQAKGLLETSKEGQDSNFTSHGDDQSQVLARKIGLSQDHESPIVIMKPVKLVEKSASLISLDGVSGLPKLPGRTAKDRSFKCAERVNHLDKTSDKTLKTVQLSKNSGSISPRMQQIKKLEVEKRSRPPTSPDSARLNKQSNKQQGESNSQGGRRRIRHQNHLKSDDQMSEVSVESRNLTIRDSRNSSEKSPSAKASESSRMVNEEHVPPEYSSPVSVLENKLDSPSPTKHVEKTLKVEGLTANKKNVNVVQPNTVEINRKKLQNIENLVQKLRRVNSTHDEARTDYIAWLCEDADPDHRYVSEILLASGLLLQDLSDFQFHPSGHPINPELFLVLEQTKSSNESKPQSKIHRKLIFDVANEILARRLVTKDMHSEPWMRPAKLARKMSNAQKLLRELCNEIDVLQVKNPKCSYEKGEEDWKNILWKDVMHRSEQWREFDGEVSGAVLDIERLIFKDLVNEIVMGESGGLIAKPRRSKASGN